MTDFEKLGVFYLGKRRDVASDQTTDELVLYDSRDLTTHAVVVGMTGSGKTGLCITLLEEAALDRIPSLIIDPKGDIANLLLTFPNLAAKDFRPWVDEGEADRSGTTVDAFAAAEADRWRNGLAQWGQDGARIRALRETVEMRLYTPGSNAGRPLTLLKSFTVPPASIKEDDDLFREHIAVAVSGLLGLLGMDADPLNSREHILISKIFELNWSAGHSLEIGRLIQEIQKPPFQRVGVLDTDEFLKPAQRGELALALNNLLASPAFASWLQGDPLDIQRLLHTPAGKPCISILSIAHLSEPQRMFFVALLLNEVVSWVRTQSGTSSLRAILYMDEVFGYFPPLGNPPSKQPMLTLLKQARAFGLGIVLATQNPVDLDYKGLSNAGTWFLGRLQTERDKLRVIEGLEGASAQAGKTFPRSEIDKILSSLKSRVFFMNNVHEDHPVVFETRWAMSYLRGPLTRDQIQELTKADARSSAEEKESGVAAESVAPPAKIPLGETSATAAMVPPDVPQVFLMPDRPLSEGQKLIYRPVLFAQTRLYYSKAASRVDAWVPLTAVAEVEGESFSNEFWSRSHRFRSELTAEAQPRGEAVYSNLPVPFQQSRQFAQWAESLRDFLYREQPLTIWHCVELKEFSQVDETEGQFRVRLEQLASERRDAEKEKLRAKYAPKLQSVDDQIRRAAERAEREKDQYRQHRLESILKTGSTILGVIFGRKKLSATNVSRTSTTVRSYGRAAASKDDATRAEDSVESLQERRAALEAELDSALKELDNKLNVATLSLEQDHVRPRKSDIQVQKLGVLWLPYVQAANGVGTAAFAPWPTA